MTYRTPHWVQLKSSEQGRIVGKLTLAAATGVAMHAVQFEPDGEVRLYRVGSVATLGEDLKPFSSPTS